MIMYPSRTTGDAKRYKARVKLYLEGLLVVLICALIYWFLDPYFTNGLRGLALFVSLALGIAIATYGYDGIQVLVSRRTFNIDALVGIYPIGILVAFIFVVISWAIRFHPGLIYGFVGAYITLTMTAQLNKRRRALLVLCGASAILGICIGAFFLRGFFHNATWLQGEFLRYFVDEVLATTIAIGLEGLAFTFVPLTFLDGNKVKEWNIVVWFFAASIVFFIFYWVIINQDHKLVEAVKDMKTFAMYVLMALSLMISGGVWLYFYLRYKRTAHKGAKE